MMELENLVLTYNLQFFAKDGPGGEKTEPATSKKLDDVRKEGQVAKSKELISAVSLFALFVLIKVYIGIVGEKLLKVFQDFYNTFDKIISSSASDESFTGGSQTDADINSADCGPVFDCGSYHCIFIKCFTAEMDGNGKAVTAESQ